MREHAQVGLIFSTKKNNFSIENFLRKHEIFFIKLIFLKFDIRTLVRNYNLNISKIRHFLSFSNKVRKNFKNLFFANF